VEGRVMAIVPNQTPCLRCVFPDAPKGADLPTCDTAGVLGPAVAAVASLQATAGIKLLVEGSFAAAMLSVNAWDNRFHTIDLSSAKRDDCVCCGQRRFEFLEAVRPKSPTRLCGRDAVQVNSNQNSVIDLSMLQTRLASAAAVEASKYFLRATLHDPPGMILTVFRDGRAIVSGTQDEARARSIYARFVGT
jgi:hypothetical protein